jgi:ribose transport system ATP-binding protein
MSLTVGFKEVSKSFGPVQVLHGVSFELAPGRVYGVLGENGAGKSTLMKILAGYEAASDGSVELGGQPVRFKGPREAETAGVVMIHQEFNLADDLSIAQNIFLGHEPRRWGLLDEDAMASAAAVAMRQVGLAGSGSAT